MLQNIITAVSLAAVLGFTAKNVNPAESSLKKSEKPQSSWVKLFDGKSTAGWHTYGKDAAGGAWKVENGVIYLDGSSKEGRGDLVTDKEYSNFDFKYEWKISEKGNSGLIFFVHEDPAKFPSTYNSGPEMQVVDNLGHPDGKIFKHQAADLYDLIPCGKKTVKPVGEWNKAEIISNNGKLEFFLNGTKVVSTTMWDANWEKLIAGSKFKDMPGFGTFKSGKFALQDHGDTVWFRNIMIKEL